MSFAYKKLAGPPSIRYIAYRKQLRDISIEEYYILSAPPFEVCSYSWDGQNKDQITSCDEQVLRVTVNCKHALHEIRVRSTQVTCEFI